MAQLRILLSTFLLVLTVVALVECYPGGAGTEACATLVPQHGAQPQTTTAPYQITLGQSTFGPGDQILVTVDATPGNTNVYRGLALQARRADGSTDTTGTFTIFANDQNNFRFYECDGSPTGAVTHSNRNDKFLPQSFLWTPSDGFTGNVQFRLTVVREFDTFWTDIPSAVLLQEQVNNPPVVTCPGRVSVESLPNNVGNRATFVPVCTDLDQSDQSLNLICSPASNSFFQLGTTTVVCICTDNQLATDTCTISVTITPIIENDPPVLTCPGSVSVESLPNNVGNTATFVPVCTDVDQSDQTLDLTCSPASNTFFQLGLTTVECTCTDNQGATDTCTFPVTITPIIVNTPPVITCPGPVSVQSFETFEGNFASWDDPICTDVDQSQDSLAVTCTPASGSFFQGLGTTEVTCTCTDNQAATDTCTISVTITPFIITPVNTPPVITCPGPVSVQSFETFEGNLASWDDPVCTDVDQPGANLAVTCTPASGTFFQGLGTTEVTCTCTDNQAASDTCTISVTITPFIITPVIPLILQCPEIVSVESLPNNVGNRATFDPVCTDQSGQSLVLTCSPPSNSFFQFGATTVVCTCTDNQGATDTCTISVTITSIGPPGDVCDGNPCFPNECRVSGTDRYTCHSMTGAPCPGR